MIVDSSAIIAILKREPDSLSYAQALEAAEVSRMSAATYVEIACVIDGLGDPILSRSLDEFLVQAKIEIVPVTVEQAKIAREAYRDFGRRSKHPARLNFGDCFSYALAKANHEPLLFKGSDFSETDVEAAVAQQTA